MKINNLKFATIDILTLMMNLERATRKQEYRCINLPLSEEVKLGYNEGAGYEFRPKSSSCVTIHIHAQRAHHMPELHFAYGPSEQHRFKLTSDVVTDTIYKQHVGQ